MALIARIAERLQAIESEVVDLHPLLAELFQRNPDVLRFEYTHGPTEMGADFILARTHEILKRTEYVGVIAKVGKLHQNLDDVNRQIHECLSVPRFIEGGKKEVHLSEVWVVATQTITNGAQRKIHEAHKGSKIHFVPGSDLAELVAQWVPHYWSDVPIEISSYLSRVRIGAQERDARLDIVQVDGRPLYIAQDVLRIEIDPYRRGKGLGRKRSMKVNLIDELETHPVLLVEANMGGGKSKLIRHYLQLIADEAVFPERPWLPIATTYKQFVDEHEGQLSRLVRAVVPEVVEEKLPTAAKLVVFIDAIDEKEEGQEDTLEFIRDIVRQVGEGSVFRVVMTSRHIGNLDFDRQFAHTLARYELRPLTVGQIASYLTEVCKGLNLTNRIVDDLRRSPLFARLPQTPLAAVLLAQLLRENPQDLPSTLPELYAKYLELALGRWDIAKGLQSQQEYEALHAILMDLAQYFLENELESIAVSEFRGRIRDYLDARKLNVTVDSIYAKATERSEILVASREGRVLSFKHRSFAEFLEAQRRVRYGTLHPSLQAFELYWANVWYFGIGQLKDAPALITALADLAPVEEGHRWLKTMNMANYVMAAYATPYPVIQDAVHKSIMEAARLFSDIAEGRSRSGLAGLSHMHLLFVMQLIVRDHYGFEFLASALEYAALRVLDSPADEIAPHCLFLLAVAYRDAGREDSFEFILEEYKDRLPIDVSLGILHESDRARGKVLKKFAQHLKRKLRGNRKLRGEIDLLYDRPIARLIGPGGPA